MGKQKKYQRALEFKNQKIQNKITQLKKKLKWKQSRTNQKQLKTQHMLREEFEKQPALPDPQTLDDWVSNSHTYISELEKKLEALHLQVQNEKDELIANKLIKLQAMLEEKLNIQLQCTRKKTTPRKPGTTLNIKVDKE